MGLSGAGELTAVAQANRDLFIFSLIRGPELGIAWWLSNVWASFSAILLLLGLKMTATASAINSSFKARKKRSSRDSCTHSSVNTHQVFEHSLLVTLVLIGLLGHAEHDWQRPSLLGVSWWRRKTIDRVKRLEVVWRRIQVGKKIENKGAQWGLQFYIKKVIRRCLSSFLPRK